MPSLATGTILQNAAGYCEVILDDRRKQQKAMTDVQYTSRDIDVGKAHAPCNEIDDDDYDDIGFTFDRSDCENDECDSFNSSQNQIEEENYLEENLIWKTEWILDDDCTSKKDHEERGKAHDSIKMVSFSKTLVTEVHTRPKTAASDLSKLFYSMHELQR